MSEPQIFKAILNVMRKVQAVPKSKKNQEQGFMYRSVDDVMAELHDIMAEEGVFCVPTVLSTQDDKKTTKNGSEWSHVKSMIAYDFYASDGSTFRSIVRGEALDGSDKASNKSLAISLKYVLTQVFMIPTIEDKDPDKHSHMPSKMPVDESKVFIPTRPVQNATEAKVDGNKTPVDMAGGGYISTVPGKAHSRAFYMVASKAGLTSEQAHDLVVKNFKLNSYTEVTKEQLNKAIDAMNKKMEATDIFDGELPQ